MGTTQSLQSHSHVPGDETGNRPRDTAFQPANHSNLVVFDEEPLPAAVALYAQMALRALAD